MKIEYRALELTGLTEGPLFVNVEATFSPVEASTSIAPVSMRLEVLLARQWREKPVEDVRRAAIEAAAKMLDSAFISKWMYDQQQRG